MDLTAAFDLTGPTISRHLKILPEEGLVGSERRRNRRRGGRLDSGRPVSAHECHQGVAETSVYVAESHRGRGVGKAVLFKQVTEADAAGLWTLRTSIFTESRASIALHQSAFYRTVGIPRAHRPTRRRLARHRLP